MIYAVEGNVNVGKTTFINQFIKQRNFKVVSESEFLTKKRPFERQIYYIEQEIKKRENLDKENIIMDRSILSVYLYTIISEEFNSKEKERIVTLINEKIRNKEIIIPDEIFFIIYPFDLINDNHNKLKKQKNTQDILVDYNYYKNYNLFFSNFLLNKKIEIINTKDLRQVIALKDNDIFFNLTNKLPNINKNIILESDEYTEKILLNNNLINCKYLKEVTDFFYRNNKEPTKSQKMEYIENMLKKIPLCIYSTKIIYFYHNSDNPEIEFYEKLDKEMGNISNIHIYKSDGNINEIVNKINKEEDKVVFLVDLFFYIFECIKKGEI